MHAFNVVSVWYNLGYSVCTFLEWILPFIAFQWFPSCLLAICWQCKPKYFCMISFRVIISIYYWLCRFYFCRFWCIVEMTSMVLFLCSGKSLLTAYRHLRCHTFFVVYLYVAVIHIFSSWHKSFDGIETVNLHIKPIFPT